MKNTYLKTLCLLLLCAGFFLVGCAGNHPTAKNKQNESVRTKKKDNYLFSQARKIIRYNKDNEAARERKAEKKEKKHISFLSRLNRKDNTTQAKAIVPPFKP